MSKKIYIPLALLLVAGAAFAGWRVTHYYFLSEKPPVAAPAAEAEAPPEAQETPDAEGAVPVKLVLPAGGETAVEEVTVPNSASPVKMAETVLAEYFKRLKKGPGDTRVLGVYRDRRNILYLDLSDDLRRKFSGDARQEYALLRSLFETVTANVMGVEDVRILIEGREAESIGGHFSLLAPLKETLNIEEREENTPHAPAAGAKES